MVVSGWEKPHLDWWVPVVQWMLEAVSTSSSGQDPTPGPLHSATLPSEHPWQGHSPSCERKRAPRFPQQQPPWGGESR